MRIPIAVTLESRDGTVAKDALTKNGVVEKNGDQLILRKRQGIADNGLVKAGTAQLLTVWNGIKAVLGDYLNSGTISTIVSGPTQTNLSPTNAGLQFTSSYTTDKASTPRLFFKNRSQGWVVNRAGTVSTVTYASNMGAGTYNVLSLTRSSNTATATIATDGVINVGDSVTVAGAVQAAYNGAVTVTAITPGSTTPAVNVSILSLTRSGTTATAVTSSAHGLTNGSSYAVSGANQSAYNGTYTVTVTSSTSFTYPVTVTLATTVTWNPADKNASVTLSGGNLTASSANASPTSARATAGKSSGKWYWEITLAGNATTILGVADASASLNSAIGADSHGWSYYPGSAQTEHSGSFVSYGSLCSAGDIIGFALDMDSGTLTLYRNGVSMGQAYSGISGTIYPAISPYNVSGNSTANFGATAFSYSVPSGYYAFQSDDPISPATGSPVVTKPAVTVNPTFSYTVAGSPATPATGTITVQTNGGTVPGIPYINGYFSVMDTSGVIWSSASDDPTTWPATQFIYAQNEPGAGRALSKSLNYLIAHKEWSTEFFYNDPNQTNGSPFVPVQNGFTLVGCASGDSVADCNGSICWIAQTKYAPGRSVYMQAGLQQQKISTPDVERILNADSLSTVYAYGMNLDGHAMYLLTLTNTGITLVYDLSAQVWMQWSTLTAGSPVSVSSITRTNNTATVTTSSAHGLSDGDPVLMAGANQNEYSGIVQAHVTSTTTFEFYVSGSPLTPATGTITATPYTASYFKFTKSANYQGTTLLLHESDGHLYQFSTSLYRDNSAPIDFFARTTRLDGQTLDRKKMAAIRVVATKVSDVAMLRWSDDDCTTYSNYKTVDLSLERPQVRRCGSFDRRSIEFRYVGNLSPVMSALELELAQ